MVPDESVESKRDGVEPTDSTWKRQIVRLVRDSVVVVSSVVLVGVFVVAISGVVPPLVAVESGSMEPNIDTGDLVFVVAQERFPGPEARHSVVTAQRGREYIRFNRPGDVIIYEPDGSTIRTPIIHRAMFYVEDGENWYARTDPAAVGSADNCRELSNCPAPHAGFVTKGDAVGQYDQATGLSSVVRPEWVVGTAELRLPEIGWVRL